MQANQAIGIDLPLKVLVWQDASGKTWLSYNDPGWLEKRHELAGAERIIASMAQALSSIVAEATSDTVEAYLETLALIAIFIRPCAPIPRSN